ncbi:hypothetical protein [Pontibacter sp. G13]|uniref:hypothetical protein n=1 Tax=Pontibacter sp. G13 TaxID=3074898 RepID=UPI00288B7538|nr:hypothetical protein [Pontibacter sp. G13]WNJ16617.1 hypothetical protein RJD25_17265 [Pontibacter sp. G13]
MRGSLRNQVATKTRENISVRFAALFLGSLLFACAMMLLGKVYTDEPAPIAASPYLEASVPELP